MKLFSRLQEIHSQIRKDQINSLMKKARYQALRQADQQMVNQLINTPLESFTQDNLRVLVDLVNKENTNAILHLGNLVIDRFVNTEALAMLTFRINSNEKWAWLINVFAEINYCTPEMFEYITRRIIIKKSNLNLENALQAFHRFFKINKEHTLDHIRQNSDILLALNNHVFDPDDRISQLSLTIFTSISSENDELPQFLYEVLGEGRISKMLLQSLMKLQSSQRILSCQIANNFILSKINIQSVTFRLFELSQGEKESVKLQISYFLRAFAQSMPEVILFEYIKSYNFLGILREYSLMNPNNKRSKQISENAVKTMAIVMQRFEKSTQQLLMKEMHRLGVSEKVEKIIQESQEQTIYCQESRAMSQ